ncbi:uncharacterized protein K452DRAFT_52298 [Aplosporella prunicola CBS 121167]|uniref:Membrane insertase YidC/Oxa/ALB C-terminal domain-containing protein n=1 Tax=Aplosporella prunicola CBS 121167 TaxID=1176127 RepID=A0A6A6BB81_9PEZI|nr:uncharacterized protein K452DRAFT_52298 [Aplosporella prunicola CBS 121167]KAF2140177.1 hypothetical protein K452DRAFT_52298 [Aplosporella prunicola CBS 121167]
MNILSTSPALGLRKPLAFAPAAAAVRYASTTPATTAAAAAAAPAATENATAASAAAGMPGADAATQATTNLDVVSDAFLSNMISTMPEQIGYLKAIGLDYGWGPTSCIQWLLEHVHVFAGTPWWASIMLTAIVVRAGLFRIFAMTSDIGARQGAMKTVVAPINARMQAARAAGNTEEMMMARSELMQVYKAAGINPVKAFVAPVVQAVTGYCTWKLLRGMSALPVPGFETGGFLWVKDLTLSDPYFLLPLGFGAMIHFVAKRGGETGAIQTLTGLQRKFLLYIMPSLAVVFTFAQPASVVLSFVTASFLGMVQARVLQTPAVREKLGLAPIVAAPVNPFSSDDGSGASGPTTINTTATSRPGFGYQPPTVKSTVQEAGPEATAEPKDGGMLSGARKSFRNTSKEISEGIQNAKTRAGLVDDKPSAKTGHSKDFLKRAEEYEKRRALEDQQARLERQQRRRRSRE